MTAALPLTLTQLLGLFLEHLTLFDKKIMAIYLGFQHFWIAFNTFNLQKSVSILRGQDLYS